MDKNSAKKPMSFYIGDPSVFLKQEERNIASGKNKLLEFINLFDSEDDRYYAITIFEEKLKLVIARSPEYLSEVFDSSIYKNWKQIYNLSVQDDREFFIETSGSLEYLKELCLYFGFKYHVDQTGCEM